MAKVAALAWFCVTGEESALSLEDAVGVSTLSNTESSGESTGSEGAAAKVCERDGGRDGDGDDEEEEAPGTTGSSFLTGILLFELLGDFTNLERKEEGI